MGEEPKRTLSTASTLFTGPARLLSAEVSCSWGRRSMERWNVASALLRLFMYVMEPESEGTLTLQVVSP